MNTKLYVIAALHYYGTNRHAFYTSAGWCVEEKEAILFQSIASVTQYININFLAKQDHEITYIRYQPD